MKRHELRPGDALLLGHLKVPTGLFVRGIEPELTLAVWCPHCRRRHAHGWDVDAPADHVEHRVGHCRSCPLEDTGYYIGVDPDRRYENGRAIREYKLLMARYTAWRSEKGVASHA
jgi:hypothetical protein